MRQTDTNIAVVGALTPTNEVIQREKKIVEELVKNNMTVLSGLAKGCDTVAHEICLQNFGKTIAVLPTTFDNVYPKQNRQLIDRIVDCDGLVISEYFTEAKNRHEQIGRFIARDRLQSMFCKAVILIASFTKGNGDSGSRHAMDKAKEYKKERYVMFNPATDKGIDIFQLNEQEMATGAKILTKQQLEELCG